MFDALKGRLLSIRRNRETSLQALSPETLEWLRSDKRYCEHAEPCTDHTIHDLDLAAVAESGLSLKTVIGKSLYYKWLVTPLTSASAIASRREHLQGMTELPEKELQRIKRLFKDFRQVDLRPLFLTRDADRQSRSSLYLIRASRAFLALLPLCGLAVYGDPFALLWLALLSFAVNSILYHRLKAEVLSFPVREGLALFRAANVLRGLKHYQSGYPFTQEEKDALGKSSGSLSWIAHWLEQREPTGLSIYLNILFAMELHAYLTLREQMHQRNKVLLGVAFKIADLDLALALEKEVRKGMLCPAQFEKGAAINLLELRHPLVNKCAPLGLSVEKPGILLTGPNMAGKSTCLRSIALNILHAQSTGYAWAEAYRAELLDVRTVIQARDNLGSEESLFKHEVQAISNALEGRPKGLPRLIVLDEPFRGTSGYYKDLLGTSLLEYLARGGDFLLMATHEERIIRQLPPAYTRLQISLMRQDGEVHVRLGEGSVIDSGALPVFLAAPYPEELLQMVQTEHEKRQEEQAQDPT